MLSQVADVSRSGSWRLSGDGLAQPSFKLAGNRIAMAVFLIYRRSGRITGVLLLAVSYGGRPSTIIHS